MIRYAYLINNIAVGFVSTAGEQPSDSTAAQVDTAVGDVYDPATGVFASPVNSNSFSGPSFYLSELVVLDDVAAPISYENGAYQPSKNQHFTITTNIINNAGEAQSAISASGLKLVCSRVSNGNLTDDESLLNCNIASGVMTLSGEFERSGVWLISVDYNNKKLHSLGFNFAIDNPDIEFWI